MIKKKKKNQPPTNQQQQKTPTNIMARRFNAFLQKAKQESGERDKLCNVIYQVNNVKSTNILYGIL